MEHLTISTSSQEPFKYRALSGTGRTIRVIHLLPGIPDDTIHCRIEDLSLKKKPSYAALSYTWGDPSDPIPIRCNDGELKITQSLHSALKHFRQKSQKRTIWADAICINQSDLDEKNQQVPLMRDIYQQASRVLIWLGEEADDSDAAVELIRTASIKLNATSDISLFQPSASTGLSQGLRRMISLLPDSEGPQWAALRTLIKRPWFRRMWIVQEVALAKEAEVHCGSSSFLWDHIAIVIIFAIRNGYIEGASDSASSSIPSLDVIRRYMKQCVRKPLLSLLLQFPSFQATELQDKIYALLGLSHSTIIPNYKLKYPDVFRSAAFEMISSAQNLDVLSFPPGKSEREEGTPSWVPDWANINQRIQQLTMQEFEGPNYTTPQFHCSWHHRTFLPTLSKDGLRLRLEGQFINIIDEVSVPCEPHRTPTSLADKMDLVCNTHRYLLNWENTAHLRSQRIYTKSQGSEVMSDAYWQTLQAGWIPYGKPFHRHLYRKFRKDWKPTVICMRITFHAVKLW